MDDKERKLRHQVNSHLAIIWGYLQLLEKKYSTDDTAQKWIETAVKECKKLQATLGIPVTPLGKAVAPQKD